MHPDGPSTRPVALFDNESLPFPERSHIAPALIGIVSTLSIGDG